MEGIVVAIITGVLSLAGVIISNIASNKNIESQLRISQAVTETKLTALTDEVKKHNDFASRIPVLEQRIDKVEEDIKDLKKGN